MKKAPKHKHSPRPKHSTRFKFLAGALAAVLVLALLVNIGTSLTGYQVAGTVTPTCTDSDSGRDYYNYGGVTGVTSSNRSFNYTDSCSNANSLREYICADSTTGGSTPRLVSWTCPCSNGACNLLAEAGSVAPLTARQLSIKLENRSLTIGGGRKNFTLVSLRSGPNAFSLPNGYSNHFLYIVIAASNPANAGYVGNIVYYNYSTNQWNNRSLSRTVSYSSITYGNLGSNVYGAMYAYAINYTGGSSQRFREDTESPSILINGAWRPTTPLEFDGTIQIIDGWNRTALNSTHGQGGTWSILFTQRGIGENSSGTLGTAYQRVIRYIYYNSNVGGPQNQICSGGTAGCNGWGLNLPSYITSRIGVAKVFYRSPAGVYLQTLTQNSVELLEDPTVENDYGEEETINTFRFRCSDSDGSDLYTPGVLTLYNPDQPSTASTVGTRDYCTIGWPASVNQTADGTITAGNPGQNATSQEYFCNAFEVPVVNYSYTVNRCATAACNAAGTACAPRNVTFTCSDPDALSTATNTAVTVTSSSGSTWQNWYRDSCDWTSGIGAGNFSRVQEFTCNAGRAAGVVLDCPSGTYCRLGTDGRCT